VEVIYGKVITKEGFKDGGLYMNLAAKGSTPLHITQAKRLESVITRQVPLSLFPEMRLCLFLDLYAQYAQVHKIHLI